MAGLETMLQELTHLSGAPVIAVIIAHIGQRDPVLQTVHRGG